MYPYIYIICVCVSPHIEPIPQYQRICLCLGKFSGADCKTKGDSSPAEPKNCYPQSYHPLWKSPLLMSHSRVGNITWFIREEFLDLPKMGNFPTIQMAFWLILSWTLERWLVKICPLIARNEDDQRLSKHVQDTSMQLLLFRNHGENMWNSRFSNMACKTNVCSAKRCPTFQVSNILLWCLRCSSHG